MTREEFIKEVTDGLAPPKYFLERKMNKSGYDALTSFESRETFISRFFEAIAKKQRFYTMLDIKMNL